MSSMIMYEEGPVFWDDGTTNQYHPAGWYYRAPHYNATNDDVVAVWGKKYGPVKGYRTEAAAMRAYHRHMKHREMAKLWKKAWDNMPPRQGKHRIEHWVHRPDISVPDFIVGNAHKTHTVQDGKVMELVVMIQPYEFGKQQALTRLMAFWTTRNVYENGQRVKKVPVLNHTHTWKCLYDGITPKDPKRLALLRELAAPNGRSVAIAMLKQMGQWDRYKRVS